MSYDPTFGDEYDGGNTPVHLNDDGTITVRGYTPTPPQSQSSSAGIGINNPPVPLPGEPPIQEIIYEPVMPEVAPPTAHFDSVSYAGLNVQFINESLGNVESLFWEFGDGITSTELNPLHTYITAGTYTVRLRVRNDGGEDIFTIPVTATAPIPEIGFNFAIGGYTIYLTNLSNTTAWEWDFGDGQTSTEKNPRHIYAGTGSYLVTLKTEGLTLQKTVNIDVEILLEWDDNSSDEDGFKIEHSLDGSTGWTEIADVAANVISYGVTEAKDGVDSAVVNFFRVLAYSGGGNSGYSNISNVRCI